MPLIDDIKSGFNRDIIILTIGDGEGYEEWIGEAQIALTSRTSMKTKPQRCFYTTGTTGNPKGVSYSHRQLVLHTLGLIAGFRRVAWECRISSRRRLHAADALVSRPRLGISICRNDAGAASGLSRSI